MPLGVSLQRGYVLDHGARSGSGTEGGKLFPPLDRERGSGAATSGVTFTRDDPFATGENGARGDGHARSKRESSFVQVAPRARIKPLWWMAAVILSAALWYGLYRLLF